MTLLTKHASHTNIGCITSNLKNPVKVWKAQDWRFCHLAFDPLKCAGGSTSPLEWPLFHIVSDGSHNVVENSNKTPVKGGKSMETPKFR